MIDEYDNITMPIIFIVKFSVFVIITFLSLKSKRDSKDNISIIYAYSFLTYPIYIGISVLYDFLIMHFSLTLGPVIADIQYWYIFFSVILYFTCRSINNSVLRCKFHARFMLQYIAIILIINIIFANLIYALNTYDIIKLGISLYPLAIMLIVLWVSSMVLRWNKYKAKYKVYNIGVYKATLLGPIGLYYYMKYKALDAHEHEINKGKLCAFCGTAIDETTYMCINCNKYHKGVYRLLNFSPIVISTILASVTVLTIGGPFAMQILFGENSDTTAYLLDYHNKELSFMVINKGKRVSIVEGVDLVLNGEILKLKQINVKDIVVEAESAKILTYTTNTREMFDIYKKSRKSKGDSLGFKIRMQIREFNGENRNIVVGDPDYMKDQRFTDKRIGRLDAIKSMMVYIEMFFEVMKEMELEIQNTAMPSASPSR